MSERGRWVKGQSGNKRGRPTATRALARVLGATGEYDSFGDISNKALLARMIWEGLAWGKVTLVGGKTLELTTREWLELVKWVHAHVDGAYRPEAEEPTPEPPKRPTVYIFGPQEVDFDAVQDIVIQQLEADMAEAERQEIAAGEDSTPE